MKIIQSANIHHEDASVALQRWTQARRRLQHDELIRDLLSELQRVRTQVAALRVVLERLAA